MTPKTPCNRRRVAKLERELRHYLGEEESGEEEEEEGAGAPMPRRRRPPAPAGDTTLPMHGEVEGGEEKEASLSSSSSLLSVAEAGAGGDVGGLVTALERRVGELEAECEVLAAEGHAARKCVAVCACWFVFVWILYIYKC